MNDTRNAIGSDAGEPPLPALNRIAEQRRELERAEEVAVRRARNQGHSWQAIASALGVSKQAAHKKFGRK